MKTILSLKNEYFNCKKYRSIFFLFLFFAILLVSIQQYSLGKKTIDHVHNITCTHYNNYLIFSKSFEHLVNNQDLYSAYPKEHWDYFKYSPTFSLLMGLFAFMPTLLGLILWNLLNGFVLVWAFWEYPFANNKINLFALGFILVEMITSIQNAQSNSLIAGLLIFAFILFEERKNFWAVSLIALSVYIKLFGILAFLLVVLYPQKRQTIFYSIFWVVFLALLPLLIISPSHLYFLYRSWFHLLMNDHNIYYGLSVMGWLHTWFGFEQPKNLIVLIGLILLLLPLIKKVLFSLFTFRNLFFASILIWVVIFNHEAESPTFIIAVAGVALWLFSQKFNYINLLLALLVLILTEFSPTDIFPAFLRNQWVIPYDLKVFPCILVWIKILYDIIIIKNKGIVLSAPKKID